MFMEYETWVDKLCAAVMLVGGLAFVIWWMAVVIPERDRKLWEVNECFVERGCNDITGEHAVEAAKSCWADCTEHAREARSRKAEGIAEL
tara:strand:+ start:3649 stop:3918 length:270 start_codon:yes stop_codon:yes gene_type:complete